MTCPECGSECDDCSGYDENDYTIWGQCCTNDECGWTNLDDPEMDGSG